MNCIAASANRAVMPTISVPRDQIVYIIVTTRKKTPRIENKFWLIFTLYTDLLRHLFTSIKRDQFWVVQVECWTLRTDTWQGVEVVTWWRARGGPLEGSPEAPRIVHGDFLAVACGVVNVPQERNHGCAQEHRRDR